MAIHSQPRPLAFMGRAWRIASQPLNRYFDVAGTVTNFLGAACKLLDSKGSLFFFRMPDLGR